MVKLSFKWLKAYVFKLKFVQPWSTPSLWRDRHQVMSSVRAKAAHKFPGSRYFVTGVCAARQHTLNLLFKIPFVTINGDVRDMLSPGFDEVPEWWRLAHDINKEPRAVIFIKSAISPDHLKIRTKKKVETKRWSLGKASNTSSSHDRRRRRRRVAQQ